MSIVKQAVKTVPAFRLLGQGSLLKVNLLPGHELITSRNSLCGFKALPNPNNVNSVVSKLRLPYTPFIRLLSKQPFLQQRITSREPVTCLLGARNRVLTPIELNGRTDYILSSCIYAYLGKQLRIESRTGIGSEGPPIPHTFVTGHGSICLSTKSKPVKIEVAENESVVVQRKCLVGFTVHRTDSVLQKTKLKIDFDNGLSRIETSDDARPVERVWNGVQNAISNSVFTARKYLIRGNTRNYVEVFGPSTVLISSPNSVWPKTVK